MTDNTISSKKIDLSKKIKLGWIIITAIFVLVSLVAFIKYSGYKKAQNAAVEIMCSITDEFDYYKDDTKRVVEEMYDYLNPVYFNLAKYNYNNSGVVSAARDADVQLGNLLKQLGYDCYRGSQYLKYVGAIDYIKHEFVIPFIIWGFLAICYLYFTMWYINDAKKTMLIESGRILCKTGDKITKEFFIKDVKSIELASKKGIKILGDKIKYKINYLDNAEELKTTILNYIANNNGNNITTANSNTRTASDNIEEIKKFKDLLDSGAITQEEFETKKKELLKI